MTCLVLLGASFVMGCSNATRAAEPTTVTEGAHVTCPLGVPHARVAVDNTSDGVALTFTADERVSELRTRARYAAAMYGPGVKAGLGHDGEHAHGGHHGLRSMQLPPYRATVTDVEAGVRMVLVPEDAADRDVLTAKAHDGVQKMMTAPCQ